MLKEFIIFQILESWEWNWMLLIQDFISPLYILDSLRKRKLLLLMMKVPQLFVWTIQRCFTCEKSIKYWHWFVFSEKKTSLNQVNKKNERDLAPWLQEVVSIYQFIKWNHFYQINLIKPNDSCPFLDITFGWMGGCNIINDSLRNPHFLLGCGVSTSNTFKDCCIIFPFKKIRINSEYIFRIFFGQNFHPPKKCAKSLSLIFQPREKTFAKKIVAVLFL